MSDLNRQQLCAELQVSDSTIRRLERAGLPSEGQGRSRRFDLAAVKQWLRSSQTVHPPAPPRPAWFDDPAVRRFFGMDLPRAPAPPPPPPLTPYQRKKKRLEEARQKQEDRAALIRFHAGKRRAARLLRTPPWADLDAMRAIYAKAQRLTNETGIPHHVDHEIPLQGKLVSGLHVAGNLQILTGVENSRKRNRFEV